MGRDIGILVLGEWVAHWTDRTMDSREIRD